MSGLTHAHVFASLKASIEEFGIHEGLIQLGIISQFNEYSAVNKGVEAEGLEA